MAIIDKIRSKMGSSNYEIISHLMKKSRGSLKQGDCRSFWLKLSNPGKISFTSEYIYQLLSQLNEQLLKPNNPPLLLVTDLISTLLYITSHFQFTSEKRIINETLFWSEPDFNFIYESESIEVYLKFLSVLIKQKQIIPQILRIFIYSVNSPNYLKRTISSTQKDSEKEFPLTTNLSFTLYSLTRIILQKHSEKSAVNLEDAILDFAKFLSELFKKMSSTNPISSLCFEIACDLFINLMNNFDNPSHIYYKSPQNEVDNVLIALEKFQKKLANFLLFPKPISSKALKVLGLIEICISLPFATTFFNFNSKLSHLNLIPKETSLTIKNQVSSRVTVILDSFCKNFNPRNLMELQSLTESFNKNSGVSLIFYLKNENLRNLKNFDSYFVKLLNIEEISLLKENEEYLFFSDAYDDIKVVSSLVNLINLNLKTENKFTKEEIELLKHLDVKDVYLITYSIIIKFQEYLEGLNSNKTRYDIKSDFLQYVSETKAELILKAKTALRLTPTSSSASSNEEEEISFYNVLKNSDLTPLKKSYRHFYFENILFRPEESAPSKLSEEFLSLYNLIKKNSYLEKDSIHLKVVITDDNVCLSSLLQCYGEELSRKESLLKNNKDDDQIVVDYDGKLLNLKFYSVPFKINSIDCYIAERDSRYSFLISEPFICKSLLIPFPSLSEHFDKHNSHLFSKTDYRKSYTKKYVANKLLNKSNKNKKIDFFKTVPSKKSINYSSEASTSSNFQFEPSYSSTGSIFSKDNSEFSQISRLNFDESFMSVNKNYNAEFAKLGVNEIFSSSENYPATKFYKDNVEEYISNSKNKINFTMYKVSGEICDSPSNLDDETWSDNIDTLSEIDLANFEDIEISNSKESINSANNYLNKTVLTSRFFVRQLVVRKNYVKKKTKVNAALCSVKIELAFENKVIDIKEVKLKYMIIYGFTLNSNSSKILYKDSPIHYHNVKKLQEASVEAEEEHFVVYLLGEGSKGTTNENSNFLMNCPVVYAKKLDIEYLESSGSLSLSLESLNVGSFKSVTVEPFYRKGEGNGTHKLSLYCYNK